MQVDSQAGNILSFLQPCSLLFLVIDLETKRKSKMCIFNQVKKSLDTGSSLANRFQFFLC